MAGYNEAPTAGEESQQLLNAQSEWSMNSLDDNVAASQNFSLSLGEKVRHWTQAHPAIGRIATATAALIAPSAAEISPAAAQVAYPNAISQIAAPSAPESGNDILTSSVHSASSNCTTTSTEVKCTETMEDGQPVTGQIDSSPYGFTLTYNYDKAYGYAGGLQENLQFSDSYGHVYQDSYACETQTCQFTYPPAGQTLTGSEYSGYFSINTINNIAEERFMLVAGGQSAPAGPCQTGETTPPGTASGAPWAIAAYQAPSASDPSVECDGFWIATTQGTVEDFGQAPNYGDLQSESLNGEIVGMTPTPDGGGYWLLGSDGGVFSFGDAGFYGSTGSMHLNKPVVGMASTADGKGYWLVASDGGIFSFGDAAFHGSTGNIALNKPVVGMAPTPNGSGYWLVASDGGVFSFDAPFMGSLGSVNLAKPIVGMSADPEGRGYRLVGADGGVFDFGGAPFYGSLGSNPPESAITTMAPSKDGDGYYLVNMAGTSYGFGDANCVQAPGCVQVSQSS